jgi:hypothetical protein
MIRKNMLSTEMIILFSGIFYIGLKILGSVGVELLQRTHCISLLIGAASLKNPD